MRAEVDRAEQSLTRVRADLVNKRKDVASLKMRETSQSEVCRSKRMFYMSSTIRFS